jgi:dienelactone hydrolase
MANRKQAPTRPLRNTRAAASLRRAARPEPARSHGGPVTRRWTEQRWTLDNIIQANGMDWDQPRSLYLSAPCGPQAAGDFAAARQRIVKYADAAPAFETLARRREAIANAADKAGNPVTARDNYYIATVHWGAAQWPLDHNNAQNLMYNARKRDCYGRYVKLADHRIEEVWLPVAGKSIPAWFHLPNGYRGGRIPAVIVIPGMDNFKEMQVALYGDRYLSRGIAVLAIDGPGQYESAVLDIHVSMEAWMETGRACFDWLARRKEVDAERVGLSCASFGTFFGTIAAAYEPRLRAVAADKVCHEPGFHTIFQEASPTFKMRFMYMSGYTDEAAFDRFREGLTWEGHAQKIRASYLCLAGESDELSPLIHTVELMKTIRSKKRLVVYQGARHSLAYAPSTQLGPNGQIMVADWMAATLAGKSFPSERWFVKANGEVDKAPF